MGRTITIDHLTRVEGHGAITVKLDGHRVAEVRMDILEGTRFYEALLRGKHFMQAATIVSRVCAICSAAHAVCAQMAVEDAFGIEVSPRTRRLRDLLLQGENLESHALHLFLLVLPDYLGYPSALDMARDYEGEAGLGLSLKRLGNRIQETVGGRAIHPPNVLVGGFGKIPGKEALGDLLREVEETIDRVPELIALLDRIPTPPVLSEPTTYIALRPEEGFGFVSRTIAVSDGSAYPAEAFPSVCNERVVAHSHAKQSLYSDRPFSVGAQARVLLNGDRLTGMAAEALQKVAESHGPVGVGNPLHTWPAQGVELVFSLHRAREHLRALIEEDVGEYDRDPVIEPGEGTGVGTLEAPRGILYHRYSFDGDGLIVDADIITPTAQNLANIERDMRLAAERWGPEIAEKGGLPAAVAPLDGRDLPFLFQVIARAYDPCISCSVH